MEKKHMGDLIFKKIWEDETMFEMNITLQTHYIIVNQNFYMTEEIVEELSHDIYEYISCYDQDKEIIIVGHDSVEKAPIIKMKLNPASEIGHVTIDVYFAYDEIGDHVYYCERTITTNLGNLSVFAEYLQYVIYEEVGYTIYLNSFNTGK